MIKQLQIKEKEYELEKDISCEEVIKQIKQENKQLRQLLADDIIRKSE